MPAWKVTVLRLTLFVGSEEGQKLLSAIQWRDLTGTDPESIQGKGDDQLQQGAFPPGRLLLKKEPGRLDVFFGGENQGKEAELPVATLGPFEPASAALRGMASKVFGILGEVTIRLALGADLVQPAETSQEAYRILTQHIRSASFKLEGAQEFLYQINRPRNSQVISGLLLNRLTRWSAGSWQPIRLETGGGAAPVVVTGPARVGAVISTDANTAVRTAPLPADKLLNLFDELCESTIEIRDKGDVP